MEKILKVKHVDYNSHTIVNAKNCGGSGSGCQGSCGGGCGNTTGGGGPCGGGK